MVGFRLAPEHPFPAQLDDAGTAYRWLLSQGYQPQNIASTGHSIGGTLAVMLPPRLLANGEPTAAQALPLTPGMTATAGDLLLDADAQLQLRGLDAARPALYRAIDAVRQGSRDSPQLLHWLDLACASWEAVFDLVKGISCDRLRASGFCSCG